MTISLSSLLTGSTSTTTASVIPDQTSNGGKYLTTDGLAATLAPVVASSILPAQSGNSGKTLVTDGNNIAWGTVISLPSQTGNTGKFLTTDGSSANWVTAAAMSLPAQPSNSGKFLTTDGNNASWASLSVTPTAVSNQPNSSTGYFALPVGTTAQRIAATSGSMRLNSDTGLVEMYYAGQWSPTSIYPGIGNSAISAATSAAAIKSATGTTVDGFYWINLPTVGPTQVYCDMNTAGGGWMLAAKTYTDTTSFNGYGSADWTANTTINPTQGAAYAGHIKSNVYNYYSIPTQVRLSIGNVSNNLYENWTGNTLLGIMNGTSLNSQNTRSQWLAWQLAGGGTAVSNFDAQPNCNSAGTNKAYTSFSIRIGITMNNEADCASNDSSVGFGSNFGPSGWYTWMATGSAMLLGWIWVK